MRTVESLFDEYMTWGKSQGGRGGRPWDDHYACVVEQRLRWWIDGLGIWYCALDEAKTGDYERLIPRLTGSPKTRRDYILAVKTFIKWCLAREYCKNDPMRVIRLPDAQPQHEYRALTVEEYRRLIDVAPPTRALFYRASALTGLRRSELGSITGANLGDGEIRMRPDQTKNRKAAVIPVPEDLLEALRARATGSELIFSYSVADRITHEFHIDREAAGIEYETPAGRACLTSLRDLRATLLQELGASLVETQRLMRHSDPSITAKHYTSVSDARQREHVNALSAALSGEKPPAAKSACPDGPLADLAEVVYVWPTLTDEQRAKIMEIIG
jgi:integrase